MTGGTGVTRRMGLLVAALLACVLAACASDGGTAASRSGHHDAAEEAAFTQQQLDQMLAPIALYPDQLLSQILMASTYPLEVVEAARWSRANPALLGDGAVRAVERYDWDPSVKSLTAFPRILQVMEDKLEWTENLGDAFLSQRAQVMDTIQKLRRKAYAAGNLRSNEEVRVDAGAQYVYIEYADPEVVYIPYYDPFVIYGAWWWSGYPPVHWAPWPGYQVVSGFAWGTVIYISTGFFFGDCDWRERRVDVVNVRNYYYAPSIQTPGSTSRYFNTAPGAWRYSPEHRRGVPYRDVQLRREFGEARRFGAPERSMPRNPGSGVGFGSSGGQAGYGAYPGASQDPARPPERFWPGNASPRETQGEDVFQRRLTDAPSMPQEDSRRFDSRAGDGVPQRGWVQQSVAPPLQDAQHFEVQPGSQPARGGIYQGRQPIPGMRPTPQVQSSPPTRQPYSSSPESGLDANTGTRFGGQRSENVTPGAQVMPAPAQPSPSGGHGRDFQP